MKYLFIFITLLTTVHALEVFEPGDSINSTDINNNFEELGARNITKSCLIEPDNTWDTLDDDCSFMISFVQNYSPAYTYKLNTNLGDDVFKCIVKPLGPCAMTTASMWLKSSHTETGSVIGYKQCNSAYDTTNTWNFIIQCIIKE